MDSGHRQMPRAEKDDPGAGAGSGSNDQCEDDAEEIITDDEEEEELEEGEEEDEEDEVCGDEGTPDPQSTSKAHCRESVGSVAASSVVSVSTTSTWHDHFGRRASSTRRAFGRGGLAYSRQRNSAISAYLSHDYAKRVTQACNSTYRRPLEVPTHKKPRNKGYVLARLSQDPTIRQANESHFPSTTRRRSNANKTKGSVAFHQMKGRADHYERIGKDHFALGPGQYELVDLQPEHTTAIKFSCSDRFQEEGDKLRPGPGEYSVNYDVVASRPFSATFSQMPRIVSTVPPTINVTSSCYFTPDSGFSVKGNQASCMNWSTTPRFQSTPGSPVAKPRTAPANKKSTSPRSMATTNFVEKNRLLASSPRKLLPRNKIRSSKAQNLLQLDQTGDEPGTNRPQIKRQRSIFTHDLLDEVDERVHVATSEVADLSSYAADGSVNSENDAVVAIGMGDTLVISTNVAGGSNPAATTINPQDPKQSPHTPRRFAKHRVGRSERERVSHLVHAFITFSWVAFYPVRLHQVYQLAHVLRRVILSRDHNIQSTMFLAWKQQLDMTAKRSNAERKIQQSLMKYRIDLRIAKKRQHVLILRQFLSGISIDVRFAIAMKKLKKKIQHIQRWWRTKRLMVAARHELLYLKWQLIEAKLRNEFLNQIPHLDKFYMANCANDPAFLKLLAVPEQSKWFLAKFELLGDGTLRGYHVDTNELVVETRMFKVNFHDLRDKMSADEPAATMTGTTTGTSSPINGGTMSTISTVSSSNVARSMAALAGGALSPHPPANGSARRLSLLASSSWQPFLTIYKSGSYKLICITATCQPELLAWISKLSRVMNPTMEALTTECTTSTSSDSSALSSQATTTTTTYASSTSPPPTSPTTNGSSGPPTSPSTSASRRKKFENRARNVRRSVHKSTSVICDGVLQYIVVDLFKDLPRVPLALVWAQVHERLKEKKKRFRGEIYRYKLEMFHFHQHEAQMRQMHVLDKFKEFFTQEEPPRPHFRSLISNKKMEELVRKTIEEVKTANPFNPRYWIDLQR